MTHRVERQLSAYLDRELAPAEMAEVRQHLEACPACRDDLEALRRVKETLARLPVPEAPAGLEKAILARADAVRPAARPRLPAARVRWAGWPWPRPALVLAALVLVLVLVGLPAVRGHLDRLRASEVGPDLFFRAATQAAADDPFVDRAYLGLVSTDATLRIQGEDPRGATR